MTNKPEQDDSQSQEEWATYLQVFLDESDDDLDSLSQTLLRLENDPHDPDSLNEAFRLLHTHKGSAGLMGFEGISTLAHELENRFDQFRSGKKTLDREQITVLLRCVDFLRTFNQGLRAGQQPDQDASLVIRQLEEVEQRSSMEESSVDAPALPIALPSMQGAYRVRVEFEDGLQLADMKARLIVARLSDLGEIVATEPPVDDMQSRDDLSQFVLIVMTDRNRDEVLKVASVDGVKHVQIEGGTPVAQDVAAAKHGQPDSEPDPSTPEPGQGMDQVDVGVVAADVPLPDVELKQEPEAREAETRSVSPSSETRSDLTAVTETVRVGIDRLDALMNLTGELVVTRARLVQITGEMDSVFRAGRISNQATDLTERMRGGLTKIRQVLADRLGEESSCRELLNDLGEDLKVVEQEFAAWDVGCRHFTRIAESVDQLSRVSGDLQKSVLDTRMVPVAPLFNRFRRVIRDLATERNKKIQLEIRGEKTELDKRMIDELGDPLLHLVRNSLDHGLERPDQRRQLGKPETGTIVLEASHRGNNVFISISDDGAGLDIDRIRQRVLDSSLASEADLSEMSEQQIVDYIWHPGFSTAKQVTDISGRGVGMDIVNTRIAELNGSIEVETRTGQGVTFNLRLPLTLAIIRCLLVRFQTGVFSVPIDDVREIVSVDRDQIHRVHDAETIDVRGEFIPLVRMDRIFYWKNDDCQDCRIDQLSEDQNPTDKVNVVILHAAGRTLGLCVDELCGSADIVIKSLSDNFVNIQGLSGASITGDGAICLMLDTNEVIKMATNRSAVERPTLAR